MNRTIISQDNSETIEVVTDETRFSIKTLFKGPLPGVINDYKVTILNRKQVKRVRLEMDKWLLT